MVNKRVNKKKFTETVEENDSDEQSIQESEATATKKSKVDEKDNDSNAAGKKSQKGASKNARSAKKVTENEEKAESENDVASTSVARSSRTSDKNKKSVETSNGDDENNEASETIMMSDDDDLPVAKNSRKGAKANANGRKAKSNSKSNGKAKRTAKVSKEDDDTDEDKDEHKEEDDKDEEKDEDKEKEKDEKDEDKDEDKDKDDDDDGEEGEEEYEVEKIIDSKMEGGKKVYLVRWKGYKSDDDTWEPKDSLSCKELIEKFEKKNDEGTNGKAKKSAKSPAKPAAKTVAKGRKSDGKSTEDPTKVWEVDKIIDYAEKNGGIIYRIRWKGYSSKHDTWEPRANLFCDDLIEKFDKRVKDLQNVSFKELRQEPKKTKRLVNETAPRTNYHNKIGRTSKRSGSKKRIYYGDSDE